MKQFNNLEECIKEIKRLRIQVDALIQIADENKTSAETTLAWRELQLAKAWLGKLLVNVDKATVPYPQVSKSELIPTPTDTAQLAPYKFDGLLDMCNSQRNIIENTIQDFEDLYYAPNLEQVLQLYNNNLGNGIDLEEVKAIADKKIWLHYDYFNLIRECLQQARFWYGFEISNLRTNEAQRYNPVKR